VTELRRTVLISLLLACAAALALPGSAGAEPGQMVLGLNANTQAWGNDVGAEQDLARSSGARGLREEYRWSVIEPRDDEWDFSRYDRVSLEAARRGMRVLPLLFDTPRWAGRSWKALPYRASEYAEYVARVVGRYGPGGSLWQEHPELAAWAPTHFELWNEPYFANFSHGGVRPAAYARLVRAASIAGRAANPRARFLLEADVSWTNDFRTYHEWIGALYRAVPDLGRYFDAVAIHPYAGGDPDAWNPEHAGTARWQLRRIDRIRARFAAHGDGAKPLWITEIGWSTCPAGCQTEGQQAAYLRRLFSILRTRYQGVVQATFLYGWHDLGNGARSDKEQWFGIIRRDGSRKPAWHVFRRAAGA